MEREVTPDAWASLSKMLDVEQAVLRAVADVESSGSGFLPAPSVLPKILFEGHAFHRLTGGRFSEARPNISYPKWDRRKYKDAAGEWKRLEEAMSLDRTAALQSASWGMFQIMGFNYAYCGYQDVEAFVADQYQGADAQLTAFAKFIARPQYLRALRNADWATFASAYNGPGYAQNHYDTKMAAAHKRWLRLLAGGAPAVTKAAAKGKAAFVGRESFAPVKSVRRTTKRVRNVRPDAVDLRDWEYRPSISIAPPDAWLPMDPRGVKKQGESNACVGFALATVIEYLLDQGAKPFEPISPFMLYSMARRYDEWSDSGDEIDEGSSLRGALKGWSKHGACCDRKWDKMKMPAATNDDEDWWMDAVKRPMGAYYRIAPDNIRDMHVAIKEVGVLYASGFTHAGWDALLGDHASPAPTDVDDLPLIDMHTGSRDLGHAFAIVGYTKIGFIVQNSWSNHWGRGGFAVLSYDDWLKNAMDCWVVQLGVVTAEHGEVATASTLREKSGKAVVSQNPTLADHEIGPFVIDMENEGRLSAKGRFRTNPSDLKLLVEHYLKVASDDWGCKKKGVIDVALYAHGGLNTEEAAAAAAREWVPYLYSKQIFPIFLMWETGGFQTVFNIFEDAVRGEGEKTGGARWDRFRDKFSDWKDERMEGLARLPGGKLWKQMKQNADALSGARDAGVVKLFEVFDTSPVRDALPKRIRLHLIGHSAGSIVHTWIAQRAIERGFEVASISLMAPAVRLDLFDAQLGGALVQKRIPVFLAHLTDTTERADDTCSPYGHSLLYLVSRSFEDAVETPILGLEKHIVPALPTHAWGGNVRCLRSPGGLWAPGAKVTRATSHGGMDNDEGIREAVAQFIKAS